MQRKPLNVSMRQIPFGLSTGARGDASWSAPMGVPRQGPRSLGLFPLVKRLNGFGGPDPNLQKSDKGNLKGAQAVLEAWGRRSARNATAWGLAAPSDSTEIGRTQGAAPGG